MNGQVVSHGVLVVTGVREDDLRELLVVEVTDTENEITYEDRFRRLEDRGLQEVQLASTAAVAGSIIRGLMPQAQDRRHQ